MASRPHLTAERIGRIVSFFAFTAGNGRPPDFFDAAFLLLVALGIWYAMRTPGLGFLWVWDLAVLRPKAILIRLFDSYPIALAAALPVAAAVASAAVLWWRLSRVDPVAILQRRNA